MDLKLDTALSQFFWLHISFILFTPSNAENLFIKLYRVILKLLNPKSELIKVCSIHT